MRTAVMMERNAENSQPAYARFAGLMYLLFLGFEVVGQLIVSVISGGGNFVETSHRIISSKQIYRISLCCSLVGSLSTILLAIGLYATIKPADSNLVMMALLFRAAEATIGATGIIIAFSILQIHLDANHANASDANQLSALANLSSSGVWTQVSAIFFSLGSTIFFYLFLKSNTFPEFCQRGASLLPWCILHHGFLALSYRSTRRQPRSMVRCRSLSPSFLPAYGF